jgi:hypothetical protein
MAFSFDHDRFANKNKSLARAYNVERKDSSLERKGYSRLNREGEASCFNCKLKNKCIEYRNRTRGGSSGAVSFGGSERMICDRYQPAPSDRRGMTNKQVKSLLKNVKRGL